MGAAKTPPSMPSNSSQKRANHASLCNQNGADFIWAGERVERWELERVFFTPRAGCAKHIPAVIFASPISRGIESEELGGVDDAIAETRVISDASEKHHPPDAVLHRDPSIKDGRMSKIDIGGPSLDKVVECGLGMKVVKIMICRHGCYSVLASNIRQGRGSACLGGMDQ